METDNHVYQLTSICIRDILIHIMVILLDVSTSNISQLPITIFKYKVKLKSLNQNYSQSQSNSNGGWVWTTFLFKLEGHLKTNQTVNYTEAYLRGISKIESLDKTSEILRKFIDKLQNESFPEKSLGGITGNTNAIFHINTAVIYSNQVQVCKCKNSAIQYSKVYTSMTTIFRGSLANLNELIMFHLPRNHQKR